MQTTTANVLIVDDDEAILRVIGHGLLKEGIECDCARNGVEALQRLAERRYSLLIIDLVMPGFSGIELLNRIGELMITRPFVIVVSAHAKRYRDQLDSNIVHAIVRKPFDTEELVHLVRTCMTA